jgi:HD-like signal output (HDOD) protein
MKKNRPTLESIVDSASTVYSLPLIHERLTQAINNPRASISDITLIISEDQGLCFRILKLANSPMFGYHKNIDTITKAATIIGTQQLRDLSMAVSVINVFKDMPEDIMNMTTFWRHSISTGIIARILASCRREPNVERFFVAGILHDIGQLILCTSIPLILRDILIQCKETDRMLYDVQRSELGFDHAEVGGELLKKWKIPLLISEPVSYHHDPLRATIYPQDTALLHVSDLIAHALQAGSSWENCLPPLNREAWEILNISESSIAGIIQQADIQIEQTMDSIFGGAD